MDKIISSLGKLAAFLTIDFVVVCTDNEGRDYLQHEYNRDGDSYRSPWNNTYCPPIESTFFPSADLRRLEQKAFEIFTSYVKLYYGEATSSVFLMDPQPGAPAGFSGCYLVKKLIEGDQGVTDATWDGTHIVVVTFDGDLADYQVFSTVQMSIDTSTPEVGALTIAGACSHNDKKTG